MRTRTAPHEFFASNRTAALAVFVAAALCLATNAHGAIAFSDFEAGIDGWLGYDCPNPGDCTAILPGGNLAITHVVGGGSPPGGGAPIPGSNYIETVDPGGTRAARVEPNPAKFGGLYALGRSLQFDVLVRANGGGGEYDLDAFGVAPLVAIENALGILVYTTADLPVIDGDWKHYVVPLVNDVNWILVTGIGFGNPTNPQFAAAIGSMTRLTVISEWLKEGGEVDTGGVDNFHLVPVPAALPLLGSALLLLWSARSRVATTRA